MAEVDLNLKSSLEQLPSNSDKTKNKEEKREEIKLDKVVTGNVTVKKRGFFKRFKKSMVSEDAENVGGYVFHDIIVPTIIEPITINTIITMDKAAVSNLWTSLDETCT